MTEITDPQRVILAAAADRRDGRGIASAKVP